MVYVVGGNVTIDIIRGFIRKHWPFVTECTEVLKGGPYFLNRAPLIVKQWSMGFNFNEEILRVIPVWVRLPNLPLHCSGEDT